MSSNVKTKTPVGFYHLSEIKVFLTEDNDKLASGDRCHRTGALPFCSRVPRGDPGIHQIKSMARYSVLALCNKCGGLHELDMSVELKDGPIKKQSIADTYPGEPLPQRLASLSGSIVTCPATGRQSTQKNNHQIFLVPTKN